ncbi:MAG TPA: AsmA-like C-terminal region-containing protein [Cyclobacteriaceae bacterium]|nr:AsmA-like C-terminal region-containing protein [Cyclobacteriaceae bacterium]
MARIRKILLYFLLASGVFVGILVGLVVLYKDRIIREFIRGANENLNTKVKIAQTDVSWFDRFPRLSIVLTDVYIEDSHEGMYPLLTADKVSFQLDPFAALRGNLVFHGVAITGSEATLKIDANGVNNYTITKNTTSDTTKAVRFDLEDVKLTQTRVRYIDYRVDEEYIFFTPNLRANINARGAQYGIQAEGDITTEKIRIKKAELFTGKEFKIDSDLVYHDDLRKLSIDPSELALESSKFLVSGTYEWKDDAMIDLQVEGRNTDIRTLLSFTPEKVNKRFERYRSKGDMHFNAHLKGKVGKDTSPSLSASFGFSEATIYHPESRARIEHANLDGSFASAHVSNPTEAVLVLKNINGRLNGKSFFSNLTVRNFADPALQLDFKGVLEAGSLLDLFPVKDVSAVSGAVTADITFTGKLAWLKDRKSSQRAQARGSIELADIAFLYGRDKFSLRDINGTLQFNNHDLALSNVRARLGHSDFLVNGFFKNAVAFLFFPDQPIGIEADLQSRFVDLDELFALGFSSNSGNASNAEYEFRISDDVNLRFNCNLGSLRYKKFKARDIQGDLLVQNSTAVSRNISLTSMGGAISVSGRVDARNKGRVNVSSVANLAGIHLDSVFYVFENFNQTFIRDAHLKGQAYADVDLRMVLNPALRLFSETLVSDIGIVIRNGELNDFEPIQKLDKYLDDKGLDRVRFSDIRNEIHIENKKIFIPQMEVLTNVTNMRISGTHTLDQQIDYRVVTPLRSYRKINLGEARAAIEDNGNGQSKLFLKIAGTTDNYRVVYDTESVRKKIGDDIRNEITELKTIFRNRGQTEPEQSAPQLEEDDYFDWEN